MIKKLLSNSEHTEILIHDNDFIGIYIPDVGTYVFDTINSNINEKTADIKLKANDFLRVDGNDFSLTIVEKDGEYTILTEINDDDLNIKLIEPVEMAFSESEIF